MQYPHFLVPDRMTEKVKAQKGGRELLVNPKTYDRLSQALIGMHIEVNIWGL